MARDEKRGKRGRPQRLAFGTAIGSERDSEGMEAPDADELQEHRPDKKWVRDNRRDETDD